MFFVHISVPTSKKKKYVKYIDMEVCFLCFFGNKIEQNFYVCSWSVILAEILYVIHWIQCILSSIGCHIVGCIYVFTRMYVVAWNPANANGTLHINWLDSCNVGRADPQDGQNNRASGLHKSNSETFVKWLACLLVSQTPRGAWMVYYLSNEYIILYQATWQKLAPTCAPIPAQSSRWWGQVILPLLWQRRLVGGRSFCEVLLDCSLQQQDRN